MLKIRIFDVDCGFCAAVYTGERQHILIDCGYNSHNGFYPTRYLFANSIRHLKYLIVSTFNEGSLAGFYDLMGHSFRNYFSIDRLLVNPSINQESLPELIVRNFRTHSSFKFLSEACYRRDRVERTLRIEDIELSFFWNNYPEFLDFANLSLVTFLSSQGINILFPGNLKAEGWRNLLRNSRFRQQLSQVNLLVASNYGREDGYCSEVFDYCRPELLVVTNRNLDRSSPTAISQYERQMQRFHQSLTPQRVLTNRHNGTITIQQFASNYVEVITQHPSNRVPKLKTNSIGG
ncbi:MAG: hypothetical protein KME17_23710 [Cyanosarcina radialis HA8281-LM2]|nr:hypothetical protein [Cyanosarcina radialis HA8281-LM2]